MENLLESSNKKAGCPFFRNILHLIANSGGPREFEPPVVYLLGALSATTYIFETFLNSFQNLRSISQNAHWLKKQ